jgi:hypothetical protein
MLERWLSAQAAAQPAAAQDEPAADHVAHNADQAAQAALRATVAADNPLSGRQLAERFGLNRAQVASVRNAVLPSNGHSLGGGENHAAQASA